MFHNQPKGVPGRGQMSRTESLATVSDGGIVEGEGSAPAAGVEGWSSGHGTTGDVGDD